MKRTVLFVFSAILLAWQPLSAETDTRYSPVAMNLSAEGWVTAEKALVTVTVNATLDNKQLANINQNVLNKLAKMAPGSKWHITQFNRYQDPSGLERVSIVAQTRLPASQLSALRPNAKRMSVAGEKYQISDIQFTPTLAEIEKVKQTLRQKIYERAQQEIQRLNKVYPARKFKLDSINFTQLSVPAPQQRMMLKAAAAPSLTVSNKQVENAHVVIAAIFNE